MRPFSKEFFEHTREMLVVFDKNGCFEELSKPWEKILGWKIEELIGRPYADLIHPEDLKKSLDAADEYKTNRYRGNYFENRYLHKKGNYIWLQWDGMYDEEGKLYAIARDITPLKQKEFFFDEMQRISKVGSWEVNLETGESVISDELYYIHDLEPGDTFSAEIGLTFFPDEARSVIAEKYKRLLERDEPYDLELPFVSAKGKSKVVKMSGRTSVKGGVRSIYGLVQDVTEEVQKQKELDVQRTKNINASKMASLGEMAANIAHEINNPLSLIQGRAEYLHSKLKSNNITNEDLSSGLNQICKTSNRIAKIIRSLRLFSKSDDHSAFIKVPLKNILEDSIDLCSEKMKNGYQIQMDNIPDVNLICRGSQLTQVFLNLLNNSVEALAGKEEKWIRINSKINGSFVNIEFIDSGFGIDNSIQDKIMEPFFTTKGSSGTGLGLSIANSIVTDHKGRIYYDKGSERTTFCIELPCEIKSEAEL